MMQIISVICAAICLLSFNEASFRSLSTITGRNGILRAKNYPFRVPNTRSLENYKIRAPPRDYLRPAIQKFSTGPQLYDVFPFRQACHNLPLNVKESKSIDDLLIRLGKELNSQTASLNGIKILQMFCVVKLSSALIAEPKIDAKFWKIEWPERIAEALEKQNISVDVDAIWNEYRLDASPESKYFNQFLKKCEAEEEQLRKDFQLHLFLLHMNALK